MNRNLNHRPRSNHGSRPLKESQHNAVKKKINFKDSNLVNSAISEIVEYLNALLQTPLKTLLGAVAFICSIMPLLDILGLINTNKAYGSSTNLLAVFEARILAFLIIAASLGWSISIIGIWLTKGMNDTRLAIAHVITAFGAVFMTACIGHIFKQDIDHAPYVVLLFSILGATLAIFLAKTNFRQTLTSDLEITASRAALLMNFATVTAILVVFSQITGLSS